MDQTIITSNKTVNDNIPDINILNKKVEGDNLSINISVPLAAAITSYSRMIMNDYKNIPGNDVFYSDTDSVVLQKPLPEDMINNELGGMKFEFKINPGVFPGPKLYALELENGETLIKIRGLHSGDIKFEEMLDILNNKTLNANHTIWKRDLSEGKNYIKSSNL